MPPPSTPATQLSYVVFAHVDDEYSSWSLIANSFSNYKVFVMCTRGEQLGACNWRAENVNPGEDPPNPTPPRTGQGSDECKTARINGFRNFLRYMAGVDGSVGDPGNGIGTGPLPTVDGRSSTGYIISASRYCAALFCDYPDSGLTAGQVGACIRAARAERGNRIPNLPEYNVIGVWPGAHRDHDAVRNHVTDTSYGFYRLVGGARDGKSIRTDTVPSNIHGHAFKRNPGPGNIGAFQRAYGWMAGQGYWGYDTYSPMQRHEQYR